MPVRQWSTTAWPPASACGSSIPDAGHMVNLEAPDFVNAVLREAVGAAD